MSSDNAYSNFLEQANQDTGASNGSVKPDTINTKSVDTEVPVQLQNVEQYYTSETDEPFEPVSLKWTGLKLPSENEFKDLIGHDAGVSTLALKDFDPRGQYKEVVEAVNSIGDGDLNIYRVEHGKTRAEYYIIRFDKKGERVIGFKAKAVET